MKEKSEKLNSLLTIVIPVKNEEVNLLKCFEKLEPFSHVILVDSGSTDKTLEIAKKYNREVINFNWNGKFPKKRNWILKNYHFKTPWVLFLDADELITKEWLIEAEEKLVNASDEIDAYICYYNNWFMGRMLKYGDVMHKTAILRVGHGEYERIEEDNWSNLDMEIHEHLVVKGDIGEIKSRLEHYDKRSFESHWEKHQQYANWEANRYYDLIKEFKDVRTSKNLTRRQQIKYAFIGKWYFPFLYFSVSYILKKGFLDGYAGYKFAKFKAKYFSLVRKTIKNKLKTVKQ